MDEMCKEVLPNPNHMQIYKARIKLWEVEFETETGKKPKKEHIKAAPTDIRNAYKCYWKLKYQAQKAQRKGSELPSPPLQNEDSVMNVDLEVSQDEQVWGQHLNKKKERSESKERSNKKFVGMHSTPVTSKLFTGAKFSRKSFPRSTSLSKIQIVSDEASTSTESNSVEASVTSCEEVAVASFEDVLVTPCAKTLHDSESQSMSGAGELTPKITYAKPLAWHQPVSAISQRFSSGGDKERVSLKKLDEGWLQRCNFQNSLEVNSTDFITEKVADKQEDAHKTALAFSESNESVLSKTGLTNEVVQTPSRGDDSDTENQPLAARIRKRRLILDAPVSKRIRLEENNSGEDNATSVSSVSTAVGTGNVTEPPKSRRKTANPKSREQILQEKVASGRVNDNFVRINLKKKVFVRGKRKFSASKYKRMNWKKRKSVNDDDESAVPKIRTCYKCGDIGHFAKYCHKGSSETAVEDVEEDTCPFPTLEEAAAIVWKRPQNVDTCKDGNVAVTPETSEVTKVFKESIAPLYTPGSSRVTPPAVFAALRKFGHEKFQPGQEEATMRILSGLSTLVVLPTGSGKSLCYQLPAYMYGEQQSCITLVISPLVALMEDQVAGLPGFLHAACLHSNQTETQRQKVLFQLESGKLHILLVSPETVVSGLRSSGGGHGILDKLPPVAFACVDEAHCISVWSHNFRPSYLQLCKVLRSKLGIRTILALTATATKATAKGISKHLGITEDEGTIIQGPVIPTNLILSVSREERREDALMKLLKTSPFDSYESIIVYCTRREQCERLAVMIRTLLPEVKSPASKRVSSNAEAYHAGLSAFRRKTIQQHFMSGKLRIVVATVAFGMGLDKSDIRAIIHYNMPKSFESYVQEIGRAGRDGQEAHCHLFLGFQGNDLNELRRHIYANVVDRSTLRKLLDRVFKPCKCKQIMRLQGCETEETSVDQERFCLGHEVAFPVEETVQQLDLPEENISTLLCYLEMHDRKWVEVLHPAYAKCRVQCYGGPRQLKQMARKCAPLGIAIAVANQKGKSHENTSSITFPVIEVASSVGWDSVVVKRELKSLEWNNEVGKPRRSGVTVEFCDLAFHLRVIGDLSEGELDEALEFLHELTEKQMKRELYQLERIFHSFSRVSSASYETSTPSGRKELSDCLRGFIVDYFAQTKPEEPTEWQAEAACPKEAQVRLDVQNLVAIHRDHNFTGRAAARIFHGIGSPCFPAEVWGKVRRFWRAHLDVDFYFICRVATQEIVRMKACH